MRNHLFLAFSFLSFSMFSQTVDWRFGFEYNEFEPPLFGVSEDSHDTLLTRLSTISAAQNVRGGININWGSWNQLQPEEGGPILWDISDNWIKRFQAHGFEFIWNLPCNAKWAIQNNPTCIDPSGLAPECAPDAEHWDDWYDFVHAIVERYDGDGVDDMPGLIIPVRFYVLSQEVYFAGQSEGDDGEAAGQGFWNDNMFNLIETHQVAHEAMRDADPSGYTKLVGSGHWLFDLYSDFPDYPQTHGPTIQARLEGDNLTGSTYTVGWDSLTYLLQRLNDDSDGVKCDYIGWHPHMGWKSSDQSMKLIREHAPDKPIFIDDMWSAMLMGVFPFDNPGYTQFIGGAAQEGDFLNPNYNELLNGLTDGDQAAINFYEAKTARDAVKQFATVFGEGAERISYSMANDLNPNHPLYNLGYPFRKTGLHGDVTTNYARKPVSHTLEILVEKLHDFTSVEQVYDNVNSDPFTRIYKFERARGTACYVAWSETGWGTSTPDIPNGTTVTFPVLSEQLEMTHIITEFGMTEPVVESLNSTAGNVSLQLGFKPVLIEEIVSTNVFPEARTAEIQVFPNPVEDILWLKNLPENGHIKIQDVKGRVVYSNNFSSTEIQLNVAGIEHGFYFLEINSGNTFWRDKLLLFRNE